MKLKKFASCFVSGSIFLTQMSAHAQISSQTLPQTTATQQPAIIQNVQSLQNVLSAKSILKAGSTFIETTDLLKLYSERNFEPIWIRSGQKTEFVEALRQMVTQISIKHGLISTDYLNSEIEAYLNGLTIENSLAAEILLSQAYIRLASHLSDGRIDPTTIDNDVRFKKRTFTDYKILAQAVSSVPAMMSPIVETLAPEHLYYKNTLDILAFLNAIKLKGGYKIIKNPKVVIKLNSTNPIVPALRERVIQQGYNLLGSGLVYDQELSSAIQDIQKENGYLVNADLLPDSGVWNLLSVAVDARILQTQVTLEKLRWLPKKLEPNMIFVNTNATEMKIYENNQVIKSMVTINGRPLRRTPMMQTWVTHVVLNTTWTATDSVVLQDKLPEIQKDIGFLNRIRMRVIDRATGVEVDPSTLDWKNNSRAIAKTHTFVMDPGPKNALGVYKFPLSSDKNSYGSNPDDIFMHFTDDPSLFSKSNRHLSSGCVRLSEAKWFAEYLLKNNPQYTPEYIDSLVAKGIEGEVFDTNIRIKLLPEEFRAVYTVPLTVEKTSSGHARFMKDIYLQDRRILLTAMSSSGRADQVVVNPNIQTATTGTLIVNGIAGATQYSAQVFAQKCDQPEAFVNSRTTMRKLNRKCAAPIKFGLNTVQNLESGSYIVGFENSIYPGFINITAGANQHIDLQKISVPPSMAKERNIKIFRDFSALSEQKKIYFQQFYSGQNLFRQTLRSYGDLSVAGLGDIDVAPSSPYHFCSENNLNNLVLAKDIREHALFVCETMNGAQNMMDLADLYRFTSNGTFQEATVDYPGDIIPKRYLRMLVSAPLKNTDFVSVMPGAYRAIGDSGKISERIDVMPISENYPSSRRIFAKSRLSAINTNEVSEGDVQDKTVVSNEALLEGTVIPNTSAVLSNMRCQTASVWRTEQRSYCTSDAQEGCSRTTAQLCEEIKLDLRFRK
jgi:L,D-transpeptidase YcbB